MIRSVWRCVFGGLLLATVAAAWPALGAEQNRFNVLFIAIDDLRPELGCYGVKEAQSPNLDRLAREGVLFRNHYVQVATCGASRYALLTGASPANSGVTRNNQAAYQGASAFSRKQLPAAQTLPELFRRGGYRTVQIGKISHTPDGRVFAYNGEGDGRMELPHAWDELATPFGSWKRGWGTFFAYANGKHREDGGGHQDLMEFVVEKDEDLPDGLMAQTAIEKLEALKSGGQPFFMGLGFFKPHLPFVAPRQDWEAFDTADMTLPLAAEKPNSVHWHKSGEFYKYDAPWKKTHPLADDAVRTARRAYLACVRYVDRQVGKVLNTLEETGLADNTVVVVWGDHGWHLGDQQIWAKHAPLERANRSVLMIRAPGVSQAGLVSDALVETLDLYPTLVELCRPAFTEIERPLDGKSLVPVLKGDRDRVRDAALSYWSNAVSVRTLDYRMIARMGKDGKVRGAELYDLRKVPDSSRNIAADRPDLVKRLQQFLPE